VRWIGRGLPLAITSLVSTWRSLVAFREVRVNEVREVLRCWLGGGGLRTAAERAGVDRKTARRYVEAALTAGLVRDGGECQLTDELIGAVIAAVRPARASGHGGAWESLLAHEQQIREWVTGGELQLTNVHGKLTRRGVNVPYRTLHRFAAERCGFGRRQLTLRVADGEPGVECQLDFARMGLIPDPESGRRRVVHALIFTAVCSRHMFVWLTFRQTLAAVIEGCEAAWAFFGGIFKVLIPDNLTPVVTNADALNPTFTVGWLDYAQARGFGTDPARVRSPKDKPRVERVVQYVRGNFFAGEEFLDLADAQARAEQWCTATAGLRVHGTTAQRPAAARLGAARTDQDDVADRQRQRVRTGRRGLCDHGCRMGADQGHRESRGTPRSRSVANRGAVHGGQCGHLADVSTAGTVSAGSPRGGGTRD
jgi:transposase